MFHHSFLLNSHLLSGTLHVGDEIREINGISVANQTVEQLQKMLVSYSLFCLFLSEASGLECFCR